VLSRLLCRLSKPRQILYLYKKFGLLLNFKETLFIFVGVPYFDPSFALAWAFADRFKYFGAIGSLPSFA